jgi:hypothetical protein
MSMSEADPLAHVTRGGNTLVGSTEAVTRMLYEAEATGRPSAERARAVVLLCSRSPMTRAWRALRFTFGRPPSSPPLPTVARSPESGKE